MEPTSALLSVQLKESPVPRGGRFTEPEVRREFEIIFHKLDIFKPNSKDIEISESGTQSIDENSKVIACRYRCKNR